jgi:hypothetical protein
MNKMLRNLTGAVALMVLPGVAQAQQWNLIGNLDVTGHPLQTAGVQYTGVGGGFTGTFTINNFDGSGKNRTFTDYLMWCIDAGRSVTVPGSFSGFTLFTLGDYAASGRGSRVRTAVPVFHDPDLGDMKAIASLVDEISDETTGYSSWNTDKRRTWNDGIWSRFDGIAPASTGAYSAQNGNTNFGGRDFYVLSNDRNQTFMVEVSEPSSALLLMLGLSAFAFLAIRRKGTV